MILSLLQPNTYSQQLWYVSYSTIPTMTVPLTRPIGAAWTDNLIKRRLAKENIFFGSYGRVDVSFFLTYIYYHICYYWQNRR